MNTFLNSVASVFIILLLTAVGYYLAYRGYLNESGKNFITKFLLRICIPCLIICNFQKYYSLDSLEEEGNAVLACFVIYGIMIVLASIVIRLMHLPRRQKGVFMMLAAFSNALFIGYPMCLELFGEICVKPVMVFYLVATTWTQTYGNGYMRYSGSSGKLFSADMAKKIITTPAILSILVAFVLLFFNIRVPDFLLSAGNYLSNCVTPLALIITGYILYSIGLKGLRFNKVITVAMLFRFILSPAVALLICRIFNIDGLFRSVIVVESAMPTPSQTVVFAAEFGADDELAASGSSISTLLSFIEIPLLMMLLNAI